MSEEGQGTAADDAASSLPQRKSADERKHLLARAVANLSAGGWRIESQSDYRAVVAKTERLVFERKQVVEVDEWGHVHVQKLDRQFSW